MILVSMESLRCLLRSLTNFKRSRAWACKFWPRKQRLSECFSMLESHFPIEILARPGKIFEIRELHVVAERVFFLKVINLQINSQWAKKRMRAKVIPREEKMCWTSYTISLLSSIFPHMVDVAPSVSFECLCVPKKLGISSSEIHKSHEKSSLGLWDMTPKTEAADVFFRDRVIFRLRFRLDRGRSLKSVICTL